MDASADDDDLMSECMWVFTYLTAWWVLLPFIITSLFLLLSLFYKNITFSASITIVILLNFVFHCYRCYYFD